MTTSLAHVTWLTVAIVLSAAAALHPQPPVKGGGLVFGVTVRIDSLDPQTTARASTRQILNNVFDPLTRPKPGDPSVYPDLATAWKLSDDKLSYTFTLRRDVKSHDGTPLDTAAVCFTSDRIAMDRLPDEGTRECDPDNRAGIYRKIQKLFTADAVYLPIRRMRVVMGVKPTVKDIAFSGLALPRFHNG